MNWRAFAEAFITLVVIMDPLGSAPIFISLTAGHTPGARRPRAGRRGGGRGRGGCLRALRPPYPRLPARLGGEPHDCGRPALTARRPADVARRRDGATENREHRAGPPRDAAARRPGSDRRGDGSHETLRG